MIYRAGASGSSEESEFRVHSTSTGEMLYCADLYPTKKDTSLYIQSLRGNPHDDNQLAVCTNFVIL